MFEKVNPSHPDKLADRIQRNCSMKRSDVLAVLAELVEVMTDELQLGNRVKLNGFGSFKVGMKTTPAETEEDFTVTKNVKSLHVSGFRCAKPSRGSGF